MKKHLKMTIEQLTSERAKEEATIKELTNRLMTIDPKDKYAAVVKGWITGSKKNIASIDQALAGRA